MIDVTFDRIFVTTPACRLLEDRFQRTPVARRAEPSRVGSPFFPLDTQMSVIGRELRHGFRQQAIYPLEMEHLP